MTLDELFKDLPSEIINLFADNPVVNNVAYLACQENWNEREFLIQLVQYLSKHNYELTKSYAGHMAKCFQPIVITKDGVFLNKKLIDNE